MKKQNGITLVSLVITIILIVIVASTTIYSSMDRFEINKLKKMYNDIELLSDKVNSYYLQYNTLPIVLDENQQSIKYSYTTIDFEDKNANDNENYYIIDLETLEKVSLNYGETGFNNTNNSNDVYIINEKTHQIYYVKGIEVDKIIYHTVEDKSTLEDTIPPSKPQIKVVSGNLNKNGVYTSKVLVELVMGKDALSGVKEMHMQLKQDGSVIAAEVYTESKVVEIGTSGTYEVSVYCVDNNGNNSEIATKIVDIDTTLQFAELNIGDYVAYDCLAGTSGTLTAPVSTTYSGTGNQTITVTEDRNLYTENVETRQWRVLSIEDNGEVLITTAAPEITSNTWNNEFSIKGRTGYLNGVQALEQAVQPYGQGTYAVSEKTRHMTMADVDTINGYTPSTAPNSKYLEQRKFWIDSENYIRIDDKSLPTLESNRKTICIYYNGIDWLDLSTVEGKTVDITITDYEYKLKEETVGQQMLKYDDSTTTESEYWLALATVNCFEQGYVRYQVKKVENGSTSTKAGLFHSYRDNNDEVQAGIRPVVTLKAGLTYTKDLNGVWQIEE